MLNYRGWSDWVSIVTKTRHDNDMTNRKGPVYAKTEIELLEPIWSGAVCDENRIGEWSDP